MMNILLYFSLQAEQALVPMNEKIEITAESVKRPNVVKRMYDWTRNWARTPYGIWALFVVAVSEASFFPVPPDVLLLVLAVSRPAKSFVFAAVCSVGSVIGGCIGYYLGYQFFEYIGMPLLSVYGLVDRFEELRIVFQDNSFLAIMVAGITPIPYKVFTIASGFCKVDFVTLVSASVVSRSLRFFAEAGLIFLFGSRIESFIERYFNLLSVLFMILLIMGIVFMKFIH